jgi:spore coat polysaccharide biosynthesis protein SpsF (cytidylyltransferase family)
MSLGTFDMQGDKRMTISSHTDVEIKELFKQAFLELLDERRDVLQDLLVEVLEDLALASAIKEGLSTEAIDRAEVMRALEGAA